MKLINLLLVMLTIGLSQYSFSQISFNTGDAKLEAELNLLNDDAKKDLTTFTTNIAKELNITKEKVQSLLDKAMEPAEIILSGRIADVIDQPVDNVFKSYEANKDKGWGYIAKELGIKPGSAEFHALKGKDKGGKNGKKGKSGKGNSGK